MIVAAMIVDAMIVAAMTVGAMIVAAMNVGPMIVVSMIVGSIIVEAMGLTPLKLREIKRRHVKYDESTKQTDHTNPMLA